MTEQCKNCEDCNIEFSREQTYLDQDRTDVLFRWTCAKCDDCKQKRIESSFKRLPAILETLAGGSSE